MGPAEPRKLNKNPIPMLEMLELDENEIIRFVSGFCGHVKAIRFLKNPSARISACHSVR